jgi:hypothetical protein
MKKVLSNITSYIFGGFCVAILGLLMTLTYQALGRIFPNSFTDQIWGLILFDLGAMCWALAFAFASKTTAQYAIASLGFATGFLGTLLMVGAEVILGQSLMTTDTAEIGQWMVYGFIAATALHAILIYAHHANGPEIKQQIDVGIAKGEITSEAIKQATAELDEEKVNLARTIRQGIVTDVKRELGLYPVEGTPFERKNFETQATGDSIPAIKVPAEEYLRLEKQYPAVPGTFTPSENIPHPIDEPTYHPVPMNPTPKDEPTTARTPFQPE